MHPLRPKRWPFHAHLPHKIPNLSLFPSRSFNRSSHPAESYDRRLQSCKNLRSLKQIHSSLTTTGFIQHPHFGAQTIAHYSKSGHLQTARVLFDEIKGSNSFLWNAMIRAYATGGHGEYALDLYSLMRRSDVLPNNYTFPFALKACASKSLALQGKRVHCDVIKSGFESDLFVEAALVNTYAKCGEIADGRCVFDRMTERDLVSWTAMITAYEQSELPEESLSLFLRMQEEEEGLVGDRVVAISVASALAQLGDTRAARVLHARVIRNGFLEDTVVGNAVIAMYAKCGDLRIARVIFDGMNERDGISWNSMLSGYTQNGHASEALLLFDQMQVSGPEPNPVTVLALVSACAQLGSLHLARKLHSFIISSKMEAETNTMLWNSIVDMYAKCGDLESAVQMFNGSVEKKRDVNSWNVMISGYGIHGHGREALCLFQRMRREGIAPNHITLTSLLSACSHSGLVEDGRKIFDAMRRRELLITPMAKHYACMVDMLGRAGFLDEARDLVAEMPLEPNDAVWGALLGACRIHGNRELGELAAKNLFHLEPEHSGYYVLMSNVYAASTRWDEVVKLREVIRRRGLKKPAGFSVIEFGREVHGFHTADHSHPEHVEIYRRIEGLVMEMKMAGYVQDSSCVLHDVEEEDKEQVLRLHSEKLAVAYGLMKLDRGLAIQVTNNLRICNDCHVTFKFISQIYRRKIIVRDVNRFHHFEEGQCSCQDYW